MNALAGKTNKELAALLNEARSIVSQGSVCTRGSLNGTVQVIRKIEMEQARREKRRLTYRAS